MAKSHKKGSSDKHHHTAKTKVVHHHHRKRSGLGDMMNYIPDGNTLLHAGGAGAAQEVLHSVGAKYLVPALSMLPSPWPFVVNEAAAGLVVYAGGKFVTSGRNLQCVQDGAVGAAAKGITNVLLTPQVNKMLGLSAYVNHGGMQDYFRDRRLNGGGQPRIDDPRPRTVPSLVPQQVRDGNRFASVWGG